MTNNSRRNSAALNLQAHHLARLALREDLEWPAAHFAIRREPLRLDAGVDHQLKILSAERALDGFADLHSLQRCLVAGQDANPNRQRIGRILRARVLPKQADCDRPPVAAREARRHMELARAVVRDSLHFTEATHADNQEP